MRYWLYPIPTDMRKGFYTLSGLVADQMGKEVRSGDVFIFINRHCTSMKALHMEHGGLVIYYLKLEKGNFTLPLFDEYGKSHPFTWQKLMLMVQGIDAAKCNYKKRWEVS
ncbi:MAG: IS66 family insertion sequence element accessory protein TnpB [Bacilli bacterium]|jgi:transposase|nr:IS66 family insertion sequence element accessory protein TnpB [Bacilli bacterium]